MNFLRKQISSGIPGYPGSSGLPKVIEFMLPLGTVGVPAHGTTMLLTIIVNPFHSFAAVFIPHDELAMIKTLLFISLPPGFAIRKKSRP